MANSLTYRAEVHDDFVFCEKPRGLNTHANEPGHFGWVEVLSRALAMPLYVVHRLDQGTTGAMVFARSPESAAALTELFQRHDVRKRYLFLSDRDHRDTEFTHQSDIQKEKNTFVSRPGEGNALTDFQRLGPRGRGYLFEARPRSGKPHQIRLHAADLGLPVLGDGEHGGRGFPVLCLHSQSLQFQWKGHEVKFETEPPLWAVKPESSMLDGRLALEDRARFFKLDDPSQSLRLVHQETTDFRMDRYGSQIVVYWYSYSEPEAAEMEFFNELSKDHPLLLQRMQDRGGDPNTRQTTALGDWKETWTACEDDLQYELRSNTGLSPGLFLDQRENRRWVRAEGKDLRVLNLFSYTGGFSLNAAAGGAREVCTVDVSAKFNEWAKTNFSLNNLNPADFEFWTQDCMLFLKGAMKRGRQWDLLICDPPTFGRSKNGVFRLESDFAELIRSLSACCAKGGRILFTTNFEKWDRSDLLERVRKAAPELQPQDTPPIALDFERSTEDRLMKTFVLKKA